MTTQQRQQGFGVGVAVAALAFFLGQRAHLAYPNEWTSTLLSMLGLDPFRPLAHPVWQLVMNLFRGLPGDGMLQAAHVFSAVCGAMAVWLVFQVALLIPSNTGKTEEDRARLGASHLVAALVSAFFAAASLPILVVSTRAHPLSLSLALLLAATWFTLRYRRQPLLRYWLAFAAVAGVGLAEFATFYLLGPVFFLWWILLFWRTRTFRWGAALGGLALLALGASLGLLFCWGYAREPVAHWREFDGVWMVYHQYLVDLYHQLRFSVPKQGWLIVFITMVLPAAFVFWNGFEEADDFFTNLGLYFFRLVLLALAVITVFNLPGSPWRVIGSGVTLVTPYALAALWAGQLIGFFYQALSQKKKNRIRPEPAHPWARLLVAALALGGLGFAAFQNQARATPRQAEPLVNLSRDLLDGLDGRTILLSNGQLDPIMQWLAYAEHREVRLMNRARTISPAYMRFLATWFPDPALESVAVIGFLPFLDRWMSGDSNLTQRLAIQDLPEIWTLQGYGWRPGPGFYSGRKLLDESAGDEFSGWTNSLAFVRRHLATFSASAPRPELLAASYDALAQQLAVLANNLGFYLMGREQRAEARLAYEAALLYQPKNASALLNLGELARQDHQEQELAQLKDRYERMSAGTLHPRQLVQLYGYIRNPSLFLNEGQALLQLGMTARGLERLQQAVDIYGANDATELALAQALQDDGKVAASLAKFEALAEKDPANPAYWLGVARCRLLLNQSAEAERVFARLEDMGLSADQLAMERGFVKLRSGAPAEAAQLFERGLNHPASRGSAALGLVWAALQLNDQARLARAVQVLEELPDYFAGQMMLHEVAMTRKDFAAARQHMERARRLQPGNTEVLEKLILLELREENEAEAKRLLDVLLNLDSNHPYGNYLLSGIHETEGRLDLAETALRRALAKGQWPDACYGLAWVLDKQGRHEEAMTAIDQALALRPENPQYLAVKGIILADLAKWVEAEDYLLRANRLRTDRTVPLFQLQLARVYFGQNRDTEGRELVKKVAAQSEVLNKDERALLEALDRQP